MGLVFPFKENCDLLLLLVKHGPSVSRGMNHLFKIEVWLMDKQKYSQEVSLVSYKEHYFWEKYRSQQGQFVVSEQNLHPEKCSCFFLALYTSHSEKMNQNKTNFLKVTVFSDISNLFKKHFW